MPRIYKLTKTGIKLLYKIRHHRGHGIHSPFVFNLITKVIEEKTPYHAYENIEHCIDCIFKNHRGLSKSNKLLFKLVNYFDSKKILEIGAGSGINTLCLTAPSKNIKCISLETSEQKYTKAKELYQQWNRDITLISTDLPQLTEKQDCIFINLSELKYYPIELNQYLLNLSYDKTFIIVKGIRTNKRHQMLWKGIKDIESRTVALDLFNIGIIFFDPSLYRWDYKISF